MARPPADPNAGGHRPQTGHVLCQNGDSVGEFCRFNLVYHSVLETLIGEFCTVVEQGDWNPSTLSKWRQIGRIWAHLLDSYQVVEDNDWLFLGVPVKVSSIEPVWPFIASKDFGRGGLFA